MIDAPPAAPTDTAPDWDPGPRKSRWIPARLAAALLLVIAGAAFGFHGYYGMFGSPHPVRADACTVLDLAPLTATLGPLKLADQPDVTSRNGNVVTASCSFQSLEDRHYPKIRGTLSVNRYNWTLLAGQRYDVTESEWDDDSLVVTKIADLGDRATTNVYQPPGLDVRILGLMVCDANAVLQATLMVPTGEGSDDPKLHAVLTEVMRTALERLG